LINTLNHNNMGLIREPLDVDIIFDPKPLTLEEKEIINKYIHDYKTEHLHKKKNIKKPHKREKETA